MTDTSPTNAFALRRGTPGAASHSGFSPIEWSVVLSARSDTLGSLGTPGRLSRAFGSVLGLGSDSSRPDGRLEALRRLAFHVWQRAACLPAGDVKRFFSAGFSRVQLATLINSIAAAPATRGIRS